MMRMRELAMMHCQRCNWSSHHKQWPIAGEMMEREKIEIMMSMMEFAEQLVLLGGDHMPE